jgi:hypothetical protein
MPDKFRSSINSSSFTSGSNDQSFNSGTSDAIVKSLITPDKKFPGTDFFKFKRQHGDLVVSLVFFLIVLVLLYFFNTESGFEDRKLPQKRFGKILKQGWVTPAIAMFFLTIAVSINLWISYKNAVNSKRLHLPKRLTKELLHWFKALEFVGYFMLYTFGISFFGYLLSTILLAVGLTYRLGYRSLKWIGISFTTAVVIVLIFRTFLKIKTPIYVTLYEMLPPTAEAFMKTHF